MLSVAFRIVSLRVPPTWPRATGQRFPQPLPHPLPRSCPHRTALHQRTAAAFPRPVRALLPPRAPGRSTPLAAGPRSPSPARARCHPRKRSKGDALPGKETASPSTKEILPVRAHVTAHIDEGELPSYGYLFESQKKVVTVVRCGGFDLIGEPVHLLAWASELRDVASRACHEQELLGSSPVRGDLGEPPAKGAA